MMRSRTPLVIALFLFAAGTLGFAWWQYSLRVRAQAELASTQGLVAELRRQPVPPPPAAVAAAEQVERATGAVVEKVMAREDGAGRGRRDRFAGGMADLSSDPEIGPLMLKQRQRAVATRYAALLARLGLAPDQAAKLEALLAEKQISHGEAQGLARRQGLGRDEAQGLARQSDDESDAAIKALLGDGAFAQLQEFDRTTAQRATVTTLATQLNYAGAPLPAAQQERLIQILAANPSSTDGSGEPGFGPAGMPWAVFGRGASSADIQASLADKATRDVVVLQQAGAILTPVQLDALRQAQQDETDRLRLAALQMERIRAARGRQPGG